MNENQKHRNRLLSIILCVGFVVSLSLVLLLRLSQTLPSSHFLLKRVQHAIALNDDHLQQTKADLLYAFNENNILSSDTIHSTTFPSPIVLLETSLPSNTSLYCYKDDSLFYWTDNNVDPKYLRKRIPASCDTICSLPTGDFHILSFQNADITFYLNSLIQTRYSQQNNYFVNHFIPFSTSHYFAFSSDTGNPLYSRDGTLLSYFEIDTNTPSQTSKNQLFYVFLFLTVFCFLILIYRWINRHFSLTCSHLSKRSILGLSILFVALFIGLSYWFFTPLFSFLFANSFAIPSSISFDKSLFWLSFALVIWVMLLSLLCNFIRRNSAFTFENNSWLSLLLVLFGFSALLTHIYSMSYARYEDHQIQSLAEQLSHERDTVFESSYPDFLNTMQQDTILLSMVLSDDVMEEVIHDYIEHFNLSESMMDYPFVLTLCAPDDELIQQPYDIIHNCADFFDAKISDNRSVDLGDGLFFIDYNTLDPNYLVIKTFVSDDSLIQKTLYLEFSKTVAPPGYGLPEVIQNNQSIIPWNYSVACYQDSLLVYKYGSYLYPNFLNDFHHETGFSYSRKMKHFVANYDDEKCLVISLSRRGWMDVTAPFAFFFFSLLILVFILYIFRYSPTQRYGRHTLSRRFQVMIMGVMLFSFVVVAPVSVIYMRGLYTQKSNDDQFVRTRTLLLDISREVDFSFLKQPGFKFYLDDILSRYSETFFTDISIYGLDGRLLTSTRPELVDNHLQTNLMNASAFHNLQGGKSLYFTQEETLGNAVYQSAYITIQDLDGAPLAYLNTPYFSGKHELRTEVLNFIFTYINLILLLMLLTVVLVFFLTHRVTKPLTELQQKMQAVDIGKSNEQIVWNSDDEIGGLIHQYNLLVVELEKSAAQLARSERETTWREMARQVAHEIRNPLTPMKLSVQSLQRAWDKQADNLDDKLRKTTSTILDEIDTLDNIASSFSSFAKLPENHPEDCDLAEILTRVVNLYNIEDNITFNFHYDEQQDYHHKLDKSNIDRALGNIIKNAIQAIDGKPDGCIDIGLKSLVSKFVVTIRDNGKGISEADKSKIFLPNFTTKTTGMGLGLSMVYNIIQTSNGRITFDSKEGEGTEFVIEFFKDMN